MLELVILLFRIAWLLSNSPTIFSLNRAPLLSMLFSLSFCGILHAELTEQAEGLLEGPIAVLIAATVVAAIVVLSKSNAEGVEQN